MAFVKGSGLDLSAPNLIIIIIIIKVFIESKDKNTYLMLQAIKIKNDLQY